MATFRVVMPVAIERIDMGDLVIGPESKPYRVIHRLQRTVIVAEVSCLNTTTGGTTITRVFHINRLKRMGEDGKHLRFEAMPLCIPRPGDILIHGEVRKSIFQVTGEIVRTVRHEHPESQARTPETSDYGISELIEEPDRWIPGQ